MNQTIPIAKIFVLLNLFLQFHFYPLTTHAVETTSTSIRSTPIPISDFQNFLGESLQKVIEFEKIKEYGQAHQIKIYLLGGTATTFAYYVKLFWLFRNGDSAYKEQYFDFDFTNIYQSTQDIDIVVDGSQEQISELQKYLSATFPYSQGNKTAWEVRSLKEQIDNKRPLLGDFDFLNQHSDSYSTELIDLTAGDKDILVKDLRNWNSKESAFLNDIINRKITYYFSPTHKQTSLFKNDSNPPIFSVIRFLTKSLQFDAQISASDEKKVKKIIAEFESDFKKNPQYYQNNPYISNWIENNAKKLVTNALDVEQANQVLSNLKLNTLLSQLKNNPEEVYSLSWWLNKKPLPSFKLGQGTGKTVEQLSKELNKDLSIVAHETRDYLAFESITRSKKGQPNLFTSREQAVGEYAVKGEGFYTRVGNVGNLSSGITIKFKLNPQAKLGTDFNLHQYSDSIDIVILNKNALEIIESSQQFSLVDFFNWCIANYESLKYDRGNLFRLKRKLFNKPFSLSESEKKELNQIIEQFIKKLKVSDLGLVLEIWSSESPIWNMSENQNWLKKIIDKKLDKVNEAFVDVIFTQNKGPFLAEVFQFFIKRVGANEKKYALKSLYKFPFMESNPDLFSHIFKDTVVNDYEFLVDGYFSKPLSQKEGPALVKMISKAPQHTLPFYASFVFYHPHSNTMTEALDLLIERNDEETSKRLANLIFAKPHAVQWEISLINLIQKNKTNPKILELIAAHTLNSANAVKWPNALKQFIPLADQTSLSRLVRFDFSQFEAKAADEIIFLFINKANQFTLESFAATGFWQPTFQKNNTYKRWFAERWVSFFSEDEIPSPFKEGSKKEATLLKGLQIKNATERQQFFDQKWGAYNPMTATMEAQKAPKQPENCTLKDQLIAKIKVFFKNGSP